tara:strand:+ start:6333 stop:6938 length:606 start_codon:yes stop_codon:yes gene_type:complete
MSNQSIPNKGDIIINPNTQRPVRVGGRTWLGLVKKGLIEGRYTDPKELSRIPEHPQEIEQEIQRVNQTLPRGQQAVRGRGKYKGKIVSRNIRPPTEEVSRYTAQMASRVVNENIEDLAELADSDDLEAELERLILQEMAGNKPTYYQQPTEPKVGKSRGRPRKQVQQVEQFELQEPDMFDKDDEQEEEEEDIDYFSDEDYE